MTRGDLVTVVLPGAYGKTRPALVIQHDAFNALASVSVLPLTSDLRDLPLLRIPVSPSRATGLRVASEVQVDKIMTIPREKIGRRLGHLDAETLGQVDAALRGFLGLA
ncbi:MAG: type II toxin-antitoxin system PemK/MazF family toxin [Gemmatimonadetes bacterium]|nr:type II toxin-antitoxin system PemK/MazF family toxin [Gemmatimonadota bacterium]